MVSLCVMGWGLVLLENCSAVAAAVTVDTSARAGGIASVQGLGMAIRTGPMQRKEKASGRYAALHQRLCTRSYECLGNTRSNNSGIPPRVCMIEYYILILYNIVAICHISKL